MQLIIFDVSNTLDNTGVVIRQAYLKPLEILGGLNEGIKNNTKLLEPINVFTWINRSLRKLRNYNSSELFRQVFLRSLLYDKITRNFDELAKIEDGDVTKKLEQIYSNDVLVIVDLVTKKFLEEKDKNKPALRENAVNAIMSAKQMGEVCIASMEDPNVVFQYIDTHKLPIDKTKCVFGKVLNITDKSQLYKILLGNKQFFGEVKIDMVHIVGDMIKEDLEAGDFIVGEFNIPVKKYYTPLPYEITLLLEEKIVNSNIECTEEDKQNILEHGIMANDLSNLLKNISKQIMQEIKTKVDGASYNLSDIPRMLRGEKIIAI